MPTFTELTKSLSDAKFRRTVLLYLVEHVDETFRPSPTNNHKVLLTDDKVPVPQEMFDNIVQDTLLAEVQQLDQEIVRITNLSIDQTPPQAAETASVQPDTTPEPPRRRRSRRA